MSTPATLPGDVGPRPQVTVPNNTPEVPHSPLDAITWPVRTERLRLRPASRDDLEATWSVRRLNDVSRWLTGAPATLEESRAGFEEPDSLAKTLIVVLDGEVVGDLMLAVEDAWV
jgi:hypothetical protein